MTKLKLDAFLPYRLSIASNRASSAVATAYQALFALKIPEWRLIAVIAERISSTQNDLCTATKMDKVTISRAAIALADRGLVQRSPNPDDKRSHLLSLSASGRDLYAQVVPKALALENARGGTDAIACGGHDGEVLSGGAEERRGDVAQGFGIGEEIRGRALPRPQLRACRAYERVPRSAEQRRIIRGVEIGDIVGDVEKGATGEVRHARCSSSPVRYAQRTIAWADQSQNLRSRYARLRNCSPDDFRVT